MPAPVLIVGQGLAGSVLGWTFEREGIDFEIVDSGHVQAASRVGAGIVNPITGQRLVKSWRVDELGPFAWRFYRDMERELGLPLVSEMRIRRVFRGASERHVFLEKRARGELAPFAGEDDAEGFWIEGGFRVDLGAMIAACRRRWSEQGRLREATVSSGESVSRYDVSIFCTGASAATLPSASAGAFQFAKGEILTIELGEGRLDPGVILNCGHWVLPVAARQAKVGATYAYQFADLSPTADAAKALRDSAANLLGATIPFTVLAQEVGLRVTTADRHPVIGRSAENMHVGYFNGLGSKGALLAPHLARQWFNHLTEGVAFESAVDLSRFAQ